MKKKISKRKIIELTLIAITLIIMVILSVILLQSNIVSIIQNRIGQIARAQKEEEIRNLIDTLKQEIEQSEERTATLSDLKVKLEEQGYILNETTGEVKYDDYYVVINSDLTIASIEQIVTNLECEVRRENGEEVKVFITIENKNGIEKVIISNTTLECKGKEKIALDRTFKKGELYPVKVELEGDKEEEFTLIAETVPNIVVENMDTFGDGTTKTLSIEYPENENLINMYSLDDGQTWQEYKGEFDVMEDENKTIAAKCVIKEEKIKGKVVYKILGEEVSVVVSDSLLSAAKNAPIIKNNAHYRIEVKDEEYNVHAYVENEDVVVNNYKAYGNANDVATANAYAKYMVLVKVNGNLTVMLIQP